MRQLAQPHRPGHSRTTLQGVQRPPQIVRILRIRGRPSPVADQCAGAGEELVGFIEKDAEQIRVEFILYRRQHFEPLAHRIFVQRELVIRGCAHGDGRSERGDGRDALRLLRRPALQLGLEQCDRLVDRGRQLSHNHRQGRCRIAHSH